MSEPMVSLHAITCPCERCATVRLTECSSIREHKYINYPTEPPLEEIRDTIMNSEEGISEDSEHFKIAMVLLTSALIKRVCQNPFDLASLLGYAPKKVSEYSKRLTENGIWKDGQWIFSPGSELGTQQWEVEFWLHVLVAQDCITCIPSAEGSETLWELKRRRGRPKGATNRPKANVEVVKENTPATASFRRAPENLWCIDCYVAYRERARAETEIDGDPLCLTCAKSRPVLTED